MIKFSILLKISLKMAMEGMPITNSCLSVLYTVRLRLTSEPAN